MKKITNVVLILTIVCMNFLEFINNVKAYTPDTPLYGNEVIDRIDNSYGVASGLISKLTNWSNSYAPNVKDLIDRNILDDLSIDNIIIKLNEQGYTSAANDLSSIKDSINSDKDYLNMTFDMIEYYLNNIPLDDTIDDIDIYYKIRSTFRNLKDPIKDLIEIYYDLYYDEINNKIDTFESYSEIEDLYNDISESIFGTNALLSKIENKINRIKDLYVSKDLDDYDYVIKDELREYYNKFKSDYRTLYNKLELKLQTKLDEKIDSIITGVDRTNIRQVIDANRELYNIIEKIDNYKVDISSKFNRLNNLVSGINIITDYSGEYEDEILTRLQEASDYTRSKLIELDLLLTVKNDSDKKYITIDNDNSLIIYDSKELTPTTFINKLETNYGYLRTKDTYNDKIGTLSKVEVYYENDILKNFLVVVMGDINPNGKIDITDLVKLCDKMYGLTDLDTYENIAADFDKNDKIDITDLVNLCDRMYK